MVSGKVFIDYAQNVRGKSLASVYSPHPTPQAIVSTPVRWEELGKIYPTDKPNLLTGRKLKGLDYLIQPLVGSLFQIMIRLLSVFL